jgi:hypothetical protein
MEPIKDLDEYIATRTAWHTLGERVLAPARHAASGRIGLRVGAGGVTTPPFELTDGDTRTLAIDGTELIVTDGASTHRHAITTLGAAAEFVGTDPGADTGVFTATTPADPTLTLAVAPAAARALGDWFAFGARVLTEWRAEHADDTPTEIQLWPEHFDVALDLGPEAGRANYGASPGDGGHELPYVYVGPWNLTDDPFWNAGSYARLGYEDLVAAPDPDTLAMEFFARGYAVANS